MSRCRMLAISDPHLGSALAQPKRLVQLIGDTDPERVYLVGDIFDLWVQPDIVIMGLAHVLKSWPVIYLVGNHDDTLLPMVGQIVGTIRFERSIVHPTADGRKYLVAHGDQWDSLMHYRTAGIIASRIYNWIRQRKWSLAEHLIAHAEAGLSDLKAFERAACRKARKAGCVGVICGHTHNLEAKMVKGVEYWNCGTLLKGRESWLTEDENGTLRLCP